MHDIVSAVISGGVLLLLGSYLSVIKGIHDEQANNKIDHTMFSYQLGEIKDDHKSLVVTVDEYGKRIYKVENELRR